MKRFFTVLLFIIPFLGVAQSKGRSYFSLNSGLSAPVGTYSESRYASDKNYGFAKPGLNLSFETRINVYRRWGIIIYLATISHKFDRKYVENYMRDNRGYAYNEYDVQLRIKNNVYGGVSMLSGLSYSYPIGNFAFDFKLLGGTSIWSRDFYLTVIERKTTTSVYSEQHVFSEKFWPTINTGAAIRWNSTGRFGLKLGLDLTKVLNGNINSDYVTNTKEYNGSYYSGVTTVYSTRRVKTPISYINIDFGIVLHLGRNSKIKSHKIVPAYASNL